MAPRLHAASGHRQRRGYVGCTNLDAQRDCDGHARGDQARATPAAIQCGADRSRGAGDVKKPAARKKFALPLLQPSPSCSGGSHLQQSCEASPLVPDERERDGERGHTDGRVEKALGAHIARVQHNAKAFKDESWYKSPIGFGSKASVVHAALKQLDARGTGFVRCHEIVEALQGCNFGLKEHEIRSLIATYDSSLRDDSAVNYAVFATKIKFPSHEKEEREDDRVLRQQSYVEKIREHAQQFAQRASPQDVEDEGLQHDETSRDLKELLTALPTIQKPYKRATNVNEELLLVSLSGAGYGQDVDRLSFEFDKKRRENRTSAKAGILLAHINRIEAFTKHEQVVTEQHENLRLAAKAMHRHEHYARLLKEEQHNTQMVEKQCKGLIKSDLTRLNRSVSKDSMFYVEPSFS